MCRPIPERDKARGALMRKMRNMADLTPAKAHPLMRRDGGGMKELEARYPQPRATFETYMQHVTHALDLVGPDHVGVGADWDGGGGVAGMEDVTAMPKITERLVKLGYTEAQLAGFWGGNALRVLKAAHEAREKSDVPLGPP